MEESPNKHAKFISTHFHPLNKNIDKLLPSKIEDSSIKEWYEYHDSNIYIPIIDIDGEITFCKNAYCEYCKVWINSKFKAYYFEHHTATLNHQNNIKIRSYQKKRRTRCSKFNVFYEEFNLACTFGRKTDIDHRKSIFSEHLSIFTKSPKAHQGCYVIN